MGTDSLKKVLLKSRLTRIWRWLRLIFCKRQSTSFIHIIDVESQPEMELIELKSTQATQVDGARNYIIGSLLNELRLLMEKSLLTTANSPFEPVKFPKELYENGMYKLALTNAFKHSLVQHMEGVNVYEFPEDQLDAFHRILHGFGIKHDVIVVAKAKDFNPSFLRFVYTAFGFLAFLVICAFI